MYLSQINLRFWVLSLSLASVSLEGSFNVDIRDINRGIFFCNEHIVYARKPNDPVSNSHAFCQGSVSFKSWPRGAVPRFTPLYEEDLYKCPDTCITKDVANLTEYS